ncbi:MAG: lipopolysaccharide biosynthesis protein, partial [Marinobacter sp.]|nr:lipopolysaccharide biosynthesis protein [Marinobacter sp.]
DVAGEALAQIIQEQVDVQAQLDSLKPAETLVVARESLENKGTSKKLILAVAIVLAFMLGIFATFMAEFASQVRQAMKEKD